MVAMMRVTPLGQKTQGSEGVKEPAAEKKPLLLARKGLGATCPKQLWNPGTRRTGWNGVFGLKAY